MNSIPPTPESFDRLVDGELSETQRKELLALLDQEPDGWRRCALAFLEAQCWKKELGHLRRSEPAVSSVLTRPAKRHSSPFGLPGTILSMAASFLLVLGVGVLWQRSGSLPGDILGAGSNQIASKNGNPSATITSGAQTAMAQAGAQSPNGSEPWQWVKLSPSGSTDNNESFELPAIERDHIDHQWLQSLPSPLPENVVQALRSQGYAVQTQQQLMPMPLKDGRRLVVPIDQVEVQYIGNQTY